MLNQQQNVKQEKEDYKITREELKKFEKEVLGITLAKLKATLCNNGSLTIREFAEKGYRIIAAAKSNWKSDELPENQSDFSFQF